MVIVVVTHAQKFELAWQKHSSSGQWPFQSGEIFQHFEGLIFQVEWPRPS